MIFHCHFLMLFLNTILADVFLHVPCVSWWQMHSLFKFFTSLCSSLALVLLFEPWSFFWIFSRTVSCSYKITLLTFQVRFTTFIFYKIIFRVYASLKCVIFVLAFLGPSVGLFLYIDLFTFAHPFSTFWFMIQQNLSFFLSFFLSFLFIYYYYNFIYLFYLKKKKLWLLVATLCDWLQGLPWPIDVRNASDVP